jgi:hypothetical protein
VQSVADRFCFTPFGFACAPISRVVDLLLRRLKGASIPIGGVTKRFLTRLV